MSISCTGRVETIPIMSTGPGIDFPNTLYVLAAFKNSSAID